MSVAFNGVVLVAPGVASYIDDSASSSSPTTTANAIAILGESERGETGQPVVFTDSSAVRAYYGTSSVDLPLVYGITRAMTAGASRVYGLRVGNATKASTSIMAGNQKLINIQTKEWGNTANAWNLEVTTNASDPLAKDIKLTLHDGRVYRQTKIGKNVAQIEYYSPVYSLGQGIISLGSGSGLTQNYILSVNATEGVEIGSVLSGGGSSEGGRFGSGKCVVTAVTAPTWNTGTSLAVSGSIEFTSTVSDVSTGTIGVGSPVLAQKTTLKSGTAYTWQPMAEIVTISGIPTLKLYTPGIAAVSIPLQPYDTLAKLTARVNQYFVLSKAGQASIPRIAGSTNGASQSSTLGRLGLSEDSGSLSFELTDSAGDNRSSFSVPYTKPMLLSELINDIQTGLRTINPTNLNKVGNENLTSATVGYKQVFKTAAGNIIIGTNGNPAVTTSAAITATLGGDVITTVTFPTPVGFLAGDLATITSGSAGSATALITFGTNAATATVTNSTPGWRAVVGTGSGATLSITASAISGTTGGGITGATVPAGGGGSGYAVGDVLSVIAPSGGTGSGASVTVDAITVTGTTGRGAVTTVSVNSAGTLYVTTSGTAYSTTAHYSATTGAAGTIPSTSLTVTAVKPSIVISTESNAKFSALKSMSASDNILSKIGLDDTTITVVGTTKLIGKSFDTPVIDFVAAKPAVSSYGWKFGIAPGMADGTLSSSKLDMSPKVNVYTTSAILENPDLGKTYFSANTNALIEVLNGNIFGALIEATKVYSSSRIDNGVYAFGGALEAPVEPSHWDEALAKLQQIEDLEIIVPMTSNASIQSATLAHCLSMSGPLGKRERFAVFGGDLGQSTTDVSALASQFNDKRAVLVWPGVKDYDESGNIVTWAPYFAAATIAGQLASQADVGQPLTNKSVNIRGLETIPRLNDIDALINAGVLVIRYDSNRGYSVAQSLTTWSGDTRYVRREISTMRCADTVMRRVRASISNVVGLKLTPDLLNTIRARVLTQLQLAENSQLIVGNTQYPAFKDILINAVGDAIYAEFSISPAIPANYLLITAHIM
jgi:hypothetical protein